MEDEAKKESQKKHLRRFLPLSLFGKAYPPQNRVLADFLFRVVDLEKFPHLEVEAKLGTLIANTTGRRTELPVLTQTWMKHDDQFRFDTQITRDKFFNLMNRSLSRWNQMKEAPAESPMAIRMECRKIVDHFYQNEIRVSIDEKSMTETSISKRRIESPINVFEPSYWVDFRFSSSEEVPMPSFVRRGRPSRERRKYRMSFLHSIFRLDLTLVRETPGLRANKYEAEVEIVNREAVYAEVQKARNGLENELLAMVDGFMNEVQSIVRESSREPFIVFIPDEFKTLLAKEAEELGFSSASPTASKRSKMSH